MIMDNCNVNKIHAIIIRVVHNNMLVRIVVTVMVRGPPGGGAEVRGGSIISY